MQIFNYIRIHHSVPLRVVLPLDLRFLISRCIIRKLSKALAFLRGIVNPYSFAIKAFSLADPKAFCTQADYQALLGKVARAFA